MEVAKGLESDVALASGESRMSRQKFSGGMRQRIMLASVLLLRPKLLIADEPTMALDTPAASSSCARAKSLMRDRAKRSSTKIGRRFPMQE
jgi:ABC-type dipeptide/oligopeptide/nickel transport system ATPase component